MTSHVLYCDYSRIGTELRARTQLCHGSCGLREKPQRHIWSITWGQAECLLTACLDQIYWISYRFITRFCLSVWYKPICKTTTSIYNIWLHPCTYIVNSSLTFSSGAQSEMFCQTRLGRVVQGGKEGHRWALARKAEPSSYAASYRLIHPTDVRLCCAGIRLAECGEAFTPTEAVWMNSNYRGRQGERERERPHCCCPLLQ